MTPRAIRILLIVSLTLNVFGVSALAGGAFMWMWTGRAAPVALTGGRLRLAGEQLPAEQPRAFRQALREVRRDAMPLIAQAREGRLEAGRLLRQPQVDQAAVNAALARARTADLALRSRIEERVVAFAAMLPSDERQMLAEALQRPREVGRRADPNSRQPTD